MSDTRNEFGLELISHSIIKSVSAATFFEAGCRSGSDTGIPQTVPRWFVDLRNAGRIRVNCLTDATLYLRSDGRLYHVGKVYADLPAPVEAAFNSISEAETFMAGVYHGERITLDLWECCEYIPDSECENLKSIWRVGASAWRTGRFLYTVKRKRALQYIEASEESGIPWIYANKFDQHTEAYEARYLERIKNIARERMEQDERQRKQKKVFEFNASDMLSSRPDRVDHFKLLALSNDAGPREIKRAYWSIAKECHPDLNPGCELSEERFKLVSHSYSELMKRFG